MATCFLLLNHLWKMLVFYMTLPAVARPRNLDLSPRKRFKLPYHFLNTHQTKGSPYFGHCTNYSKLMLVLYLNISKSI